MSWGLPNFYEDFATEAGLDGFFAGHDALARRDEDETTAGFDLWNLIGSNVDAAAWLAHFFDFVNASIFAFVHDLDLQDIPRSAFLDFVASDETSFDESVEDGNF